MTTRYIFIATFLFLHSLVLLASNPGKKNILFLDFNNAPLEIQRFSKNFTIIPLPSYESISPTARNLIDDLIKSNADARADFLQKKKSCQSRELSCSEYSFDAFSRLIQIQQAAVDKARNLYSTAHFVNEITQVSQSPSATEIRGIVISGHHSKGAIYGELVQANVDVLEDYFSRNAAHLKNVKFLVLLACNSGQADMIKKWSRILPSLEVIIGADGSAPLKTDIVNLNFIEKVSQNLQDMFDSKPITNDQQALDFFNKIKFSNWWVALLWKDKKEKREFYYTTGSQN